MKTNIFRNTAIILPLVLLAVIPSKVTANSILENGKSGNNAAKNIVKLAQVPSKDLPAAPGTEQSNALKSQQTKQSVQLDSLSSFVPPRTPATVVKQRNFSIPFALTPSQNTGPFSVELLSSSDQGKSWVSSGKIECPSSQKEFYFRAERDGEYWFVLRTSFPGGNRKTSPVQAILIKTDENEKMGQSAGSSQTTKIGQTKKETSSAPTGAHSSAGLTVGAGSANKSSKPVVAGKPDLAASKPRTKTSTVPSLSLPAKVVDSSPVDTEESREERAKKLLELASAVPSDEGGKNPTAGSTGQQAPALASAGSTPSGISVSPLSSSGKTNAPNGVAGKADRIDKTTQAKGPGQVEKPEEIAFPGQIKSISIGKTQVGEPTIMVRWFRPEDVGLPAGTKGSLRIERSEKAEGPWMTIVSDLQKDQPGYWWKATQLDTVPFYLRIVMTDENGKESSDTVKQKLELASRLQGPSNDSQTAASANAGGNNTSDSTSGISQPKGTSDAGTAKPKEVDHVVKTGAKTTEKRFLSRLFKRDDKQESRDVPPTPQESLARSNMKETAQGKNKERGVTGVPAATYDSANSAATVNEPSPVFQIPNAGKDNSGPWKEAGLERQIDSQTQSLQTQQNTQRGQNGGGQENGQTAPYSNGVRTAKSYQPPRRNYDPGVLNWNPLFTEGFGALFTGQQPQVDRVDMQSVQGGKVETPAAPKKRSIFTPPERYNALPKQEETGYNGASGAYFDGTNPMNQGMMNQGAGMVSDPSGTMADGMIAGDTVMSGDSGVIPGGNATGGMINAQGAMSGPSPGVNSSEIIYLDQHGNRIANPFASGAMNSWSGNGAMPGNVSGVPGGPVEGGQYMMDSTGNLVPYSPSAMSGMSGVPLQPESPFSTSGSGTFVPGANSSNTVGVPNGALPSGTGSPGGAGMTMPGPR